MSTAPSPALLLSAVPVFRKKTRLHGDRLLQFEESVAAAYRGDHSIRALVAHTGRSYGCVHRALRNSGVVMRKRGGDTRSARRTEAAR
ncbi:helix-turn-helix domain-containing protein [Streptomyces sp. NPDC050161]|uniref:helix-turn-helix domain-containing protein n=1 Tax=Streptomyces sp. NPDC050161 TaxID=3365604 RepID=UPI00379739DB